MRADHIAGRGLIALLVLSLLCFPAAASAHHGQDSDWEYVDLGEGGDSDYIKSGFAQANVSPFTCHVDGQREDTTARYQQMNTHNIIELEVDPSQDLHLSFCVEKGEAQDQWVLRVNGYFICRSSPEVGLPHHYIDLVVPSRYLVDDTVELDFHNTSRDGNGANTYGVNYRQ